MSSHEKLMILCKELKSGKTIISSQEQKVIDQKWRDMAKTSTIKRRMLAEQKVSRK